MKLLISMAGVLAVVTYSYGQSTTVASTTIATMETTVAPTTAALATTVTAATTTAAVVEITTAAASISTASAQPISTASVRASTPTPVARPLNCGRGNGRGGRIGSPRVRGGRSGERGGRSREHNEPRKSIIRRVHPQARRSEGRGLRAGRRAGGSRHRD